MPLTVCETAAEAVAGVRDGATVMVGGFGPAGQPVHLLQALLETGAGDLTVVSNNAGNGDTGLAALVGAGRVRRMVCSFPRQADSHHFDRRYRAGEIELELVPQGVLAEGKEVRELDGRMQVLETALRADLALVRAHRADGLGNLVYRRTARNFGPVMATAAATTAVEVAELVATGSIDPETVVTPGLYVDRVVVVPSAPAVAS